MIREEYAVASRTAPDQKSKQKHRQSSVTGRYQWWLLRLGILLVLVVLGLVATRVIDASGVRAHVLAAVANACSPNTAGYSLLKEQSGASVKSRSSVAVCEELVRLKPDDAPTRAMLGLAYTDVGRTKEAIACYEQALALDPDCFDAHLGMGKMAFGRGAYPEAIAAYRKAVKIRPRSADAQLSLGLALSNAGQYEEAIQAFQRAKELDPAIVETQVITGQTYLQAGMCAQAIQCFKEAVQTDQAHARAYFNLGRAYLRVGDRGLALEQQRILQGLDQNLADQLLQMINP